MPYFLLFAVDVLCILVEEMRLYGFVFAAVPESVAKIGKIWRAPHLFCSIGCAQPIWQIVAPSAQKHLNFAISIGGSLVLTSPSAL